MLVSVQDKCMVCAKCTIGSENHFARTRWYFYVTRLKWKLVLVHLEILLILTEDRCMVCVKRTIASEIILVRTHPIELLVDEAQVEAHFDPFGDSANLDVDRCTVFAECTIGSKIVLVRIEIVLILTQDRCIVCVEHTIGLENILDSPDGAPR
jgi:hypothetical protein